jgi:glucose/arabinose dehydrogenase
MPQLSHLSRSLSVGSLVLLGACADANPVGPTSTPSLGRAKTTAAGAVSVVMTGLNAPKQLAFGPEGALYVAETGTGALSDSCVPAGDQGEEACYSLTGSITRYWKGEQERIVTGLPSLGSPGNVVAGPHDIAFQGRGNMYVTIGLGADPARREELGAEGATLGTLIVVKPNGKWSIVADISGFEAANNPDNGVPDSNPYGVLAERGRQYVTDAGGNSLLEVSPNGQLSLVATFADLPLPPLPLPFTSSQAVPTEVVRGPDGALYVSTLTGVPFLPGLARIYRVAPGGASTVFEGGFTTITDFDFGPDGSLYVLQFASELFTGGVGSVVRVSPDGTRTTLYSGLMAPTGLAVGPDGAVYVTNKGVLVGAGEVLRIAP